jgi:hypothetical protein
VTPEGVKALYFRNPGKPSSQTLKKLFEVLLSEFARTYIVLDALDEIAVSEREAFLSILCQMISGSFGNLNTLLTSRHEHYISKELDPLLVTEVNMNIGWDPFSVTEVNKKKERVDVDIDLFISGVLQEDDRFKDWGPSIQAEAKTALLTGACGMYVASICINWGFVLIAFKVQMGRVSAGQPEEVLQ